MVSKMPFEVVDPRGRGTPGPIPLLAGDVATGGPGTQQAGIGLPRGQHRLDQFIYRGVSPEVGGIDDLHRAGVYPPGVRTRVAKIAIGVCAIGAVLLLLPAQYVSAIGLDL